MQMVKTKEELISTIINEKNILIVQDLDGVCIPLVQDPLKRVLDKEYINAVSKLKDNFSVLTCGEHDWRIGVNRLVEKALGSKTKADPLFWNKTPDLGATIPLPNDENIEFINETAFLFWSTTET